MLIPIVGQQFYVFPQNVFQQNAWFLSEMLSFFVTMECHHYIVACQAHPVLVFKRVNEIR